MSLKDEFPDAPHDMTDVHKGQGRPMPEEWKKKIDMIRYLFGKGVKINRASKLSKAGWRTVRAEYKRLAGQLIEQDDRMWIEKQEENKAQLIEALDGWYTEELKIYEEMKEFVNQHTEESKKKKLPVDKDKLMWRERREIVEQLFVMAEKKFVIETTPVVAEKIREEIKELATKYMGKSNTISV